MQTVPPPSTTRRLVAVACLALLVACTSGGDEPAPDGTDQTTGSDDIEQSREVLADPMLTLGQAVIELGSVVEEARFEAARGTPMLEAAADVPEAVAGVRSAAQDAADAADEATVEAAAEIVAGAAAAAERAAEAADGEAAYLRRLGRVDAALLDIAAQWDRPGSQSEIRERLAAATEDAKRARGQLRGLRPSPRACRTMVQNRAGWADTVRTRTAQLQAQANSAGGTEYDELRSAYRRLPLGVEPRTADQRERACWEDRSPVARAVERLRKDVEALEAALQ